MLGSKSRHGRFAEGLWPIALVLFFVQNPGAYPQSNPARTEQGAARTQSSPSRDAYGDALPGGAIRRFGSLRLRHSGGIQQMLYAADETGLATVSGDGVVRMWEARTGELRWQFTFDKPSECALAREEGGKSLAALTTSSYVVLDSATGAKVLERRMPEDPQMGPITLAIAPDLRSYVCAALDGTVRCYDARTGEEKKKFAAGDQSGRPCHLEMQLSQHGDTLTVLPTGNCQVKAYDTASGRKIWEFSANAHPIYAFSLSSDGRSLVICNGQDHLICAEQRDCGWKRLFDFESKDYEGVGLPVFSPDGKLLAAVSWSQLVVLDKNTGNLLRRIKHPGVGRLAFSSDSKTLAGVNAWQCSVLQWDVATGELLSPRPDPIGSITGIRFLPGGKELFSFSDQAIWWDVATGKTLRQLDVNVNRCEGWALSPDGKLLAVGSSKPIAATTAEGLADIVFLNTATGARATALSGHQGNAWSLTFSPDGAKLFSVGNGPPNISVWDTAKKEINNGLAGLTEAAQRVAIAPNGRWLVSARIHVIGNGSEISV